MDETIQLELDKLKTQIADLKEKNETLEKQELIRLKKEYEHLCETLLLVVDDGDNTETKWKHFIDIVESSEVLNDIVEVNSPVSDIFGKQFKDILIEATHKNFTSLLEVDDDRKLFAKIIDNIVDNPILESILISNPVTHLVSSVIDIVGGFFKNNRNGKGAKKIIKGAKEVFDKEQIKNFYSDLEHYIVFYEQLNKASKLFTEQKTSFDKQLPKLNKLMDNYHEKFFSTMGLNYEKNGRNSDKVRDLLKITEGDANSYKAILENAKIEQAYKAALKFPALRNQIILVKGDFYKIIVVFLEKYEETLTTLKVNKKETIVLAEVEKLEERIGKFKLKLTEIIQRAAIS